MGWVELSEEEQKTVKISEIQSRVEEEKEIATTAMAASDITIETKIAWNDYLLALDKVCLCRDFDCDPKFPPRPL